MNKKQMYNKSTMNEQIIHLSLRLPKSLHQKLKESARINHRSLHGEAFHAIEVYLSLKPRVEYIIEPQREEEEKT